MKYTAQLKTALKKPVRREVSRLMKPLLFVVAVISVFWAAKLFVLIGSGSPLDYSCARSLYTLGRTCLLLALTEVIIGGLIADIGIKDIKE